MYTVGYLPGHTGEAYRRNTHPRHIGGIPTLDSYLALNLPPGLISGIKPPSWAYNRR